MFEAEALVLAYETEGGFTPRELIEGILEIFEAEVTADVIMQRFHSPE